MFVGRSEELEILHRLLKKPSASAMIYGKRKVGKTTLIDKALEASQGTVRTDYRRMPCSCGNFCADFGSLQPL